jgi:hypothetical protein
MRPIRPPYIAVAADERFSPLGVGVGASDSDADLARRLQAEEDAEYARRLAAGHVGEMPSRSSLQPTAPPVSQPSQDVANFYPEVCSGIWIL